MAATSTQSLLEVVATFGGCLLALIGLRHGHLAHRQGASHGRWIGGGLILIGVSAIIHGLASHVDPDFEFLLLRKSVTLLSLGGLACLHLAATRGPARPITAAIVRSTLAIAAVATIGLPSLHYEAPNAPAWWSPYGAFLVATFVATSAHATIATWAIAPNLPAAAANRTRLLSVGVGSMGLVLATGVAGALAPGTTSGIAVALAVMLLPPAMICITPPALVRRRLRRSAMNSLEEALQALVGDVDGEDVGALLPGVAGVLGATEVTVASAEGTVLHRHEANAWLDEARHGGTSRTVGLRSGELRTWIHPLAPLTGPEERMLLRHVGRSVDLALLASERLRALDTERRTRADLEAARSRLDTANTALREYGAAVAHDLKTPMTVIRGTVETVLATEPIGELGRDLLSRAIHHVDRATELVQGHLVTALEPSAAGRVSLPHVVRWVEHTLAEELSRAHASLAWSPSLPVVHGSEPVLRRVLLNLVRNSLQHASGPEPLMIGIAVADKGATILVIDDGRGIPRDEWEHVFDAGARLEGARRGGHGLGLGSARVAVRRMGGDLVIVDSEEGQGTTFAIHLPDPSVPTTSSEAPEPLATGARSEADLAQRWPSTKR